MFLLMILILYTVIGVEYVIVFSDQIDDCGWLAMMGDSRNVRSVLASNLLLLPYFWSFPYYLMVDEDTPGLMHLAFKFRWTLGLLGEVLFTILGLALHIGIGYLVYRFW